MNRYSFVFATVTVLSAALVFPRAALTASGGMKMYHADIDLSDKLSLQRGARLFTNYCVSCHSASLMRYNRLAEDLQLTEKQVAENLMFASEKVVEPMTVAMRPADAKNWFGAAPPDLSVIARSRGADYLYTYLTTYYKDENPQRPFGVNNLAFAGTSMPHVLWRLQGTQVPVYEEATDADGKTHKKIVGLKIEEPGTMNQAEYRHSMNDLVNFLTYLGEPAKLHRYRVGMWVLAFLALFFVLARSLYKEYWKDVH